MTKLKLLVLASHPIPYYAPLYRELARHEEIDLKVLYGSDYGVRPGKSKWGVDDFTWKTNLTEGYAHAFLRNVSPRPDPSTLAGKLNPGLIPAIRRCRPDAVLCTGYTGPYHLQGILGAFALNVPAVFHCDNNAAAAQPKGFKGKLKPYVLRKLYARFEAFLVIGERNREHFRSFGVPDDKMFEFPYAVDNEHFSREAERLRPRREELRAAWGVNSACVLYSGRLAPEKNLGELIEGVSRVDGLHLLLVGDGPERERLAKLAAELLPGRHTFAGFLNQDRLGEAYAASDIFALTSRHEPWGVVCNEAMNFGLPLVVSDRVGCAPDLVRQGETGWAYPLGDVGGLARALSEAKTALDPETSAAVKRHVSGFNYRKQTEGVVAAAKRAASRDFARLAEQYLKILQD